MPITKNGEEVNSAAQPRHSKTRAGARNEKLQHAGYQGPCSSSSSCTCRFSELRIPVSHPSALAQGEAEGAALTRPPFIARAQIKNTKQPKVINTTRSPWTQVAGFQHAACHPRLSHSIGSVLVPEGDAKVEQVHRAPLGGHQLAEISTLHQGLGYLELPDPGHLTVLIPNQAIHIGHL